jgi:glycosyltransferase involved in cell wall biosynthesis
MISQTDPWGPASGARLRQRLVLEALGRDHLVDLVVVSQAAATTDPASTGTRVDRRLDLALPPRQATNGRRARWLLSPRQPLELLGRDTRDLQTALRSWLRGPYAIVWVTRSATFDAVAEALPPAPTVLDIDDLEGFKAAARLRQSINERTTWVPRVRWIRDARNVTAWHRLDRRTADAADVAVLCSEHDRVRFGCPGTHVVPNGYPRPAQPVGRPRAGSPATVLLQGELTYGPNLEGARWFTQSVFPAIADALAHDVQLRLVGRSDDRLADLHRPPAVTVTGFVEDLQSELAGADLVVAPIRYGGGTRIKILEAWAHRIPVVATRIGAEGLEAVDGEHVLLADTAREFAASCVHALTDVSLRARLAGAGQRHYLRAYDASAIVERAASLVDAMTAPDDTVRHSSPPYRPLVPGSR